MGIGSTAIQAWCTRTTRSSEFTSLCDLPLSLHSLHRRWQWLTRPAPPSTASPFRPCPLSVGPLPWQLRHPHHHTSLWWTTKLVCPGATPGRCTRNAATSDKCCHPGFNHTIPRNATGSGGLLYARSADGVSWQRPNLGRVEVLGSTNNNVVFKIVGSAASQVGIFFDDRTGRFRSFGKVYPRTAAHPLCRNAGRLT